MNMRMEIGKLLQNLKATMVYVTHDQVEAMTLADKIVVLKDGEVMQVGAPMDLYHHPANLFVAGFLGAPSMNFIPVAVRAVAGERATVANAALDPIEVSTAGRAIVAGGKAILGIRPQYLVPSPVPSEGMLHGNIVLTERLGAETVVEVVLKDGSSIIAALNEDHVLRPGAEIGLRFDPGRAHLFDAR
jgi:multiple sugar transport system ATP-binding protein